MKHELCGDGAVWRPIALAAGAIDDSARSLLLRRPGRSSMRVLFASILLLAAALVAVQDADAQTFPRREPVGFTWGELAVLPEYCKDTQGTVWDVYGGGGPMAPNTEKWVALMGQEFLHAHHYCYGLRNVLRAQAVGENSQQGKELLRRAVGEFGYMFRNSAPDMPLLPEIYLKEGEVHLKLGNIVEAAQSFERSRQLKRDYWPPYARWADFLVSLRQFEAARKLLAEGLVYSPGEAELTKRLAALERSGGQARTGQATPAESAAPKR